MDPFKMVVPSIQVYHDLAEMLNNSVIAANELCVGLKNDIDDMSAAVDYFKTEVEVFLQKLSAEIAKAEAALAKKQEEAKAALEKVQSCDEILQQYKKTSDVIDDEKVGVSDEVNELYDNTPEGEKPDVSDQVQHVTELDRQGLQLSRDVLRVQENKKQYEEALAEKEAEVTEAQNKLDALRKKLLLVKSKYQSLMTTYENIGAVAYDQGLTDIFHPVNEVYKDATATVYKLHNVADRLNEAKRT